MSDAHRHEASGRRWRRSTLRRRPGEPIEVPARARACSTRPTVCGLDVAAPCGGQGRCGRCRVRVDGGDVRRRSNAGLATAEIARRLGAGLPDRDVDGDAVGRRCPSGEGERSARTATPSPSRSRCPSPATGASDPAVRIFDAGDRAAVAGRQHERLRPPAARARPAARHQGACAPSCRMLRDSARTCAWPTGRSPWRSRCATGCTASYLPPRLLRVYPSAFPQREPWASPSTSAPPSVVVYLVDFETGRVVDTAQRLQRADRLRRGRDLAHHLRQAQAAAWPGCSASSSRRSTSSSTSCSSATASSCARSTRWPSPATRP